MKIIFTDLDGTLLEHGTYSFKKAGKTLRALEKKSVPVIFSSSKTIPEMLELRKKMRNTEPFIAENGAAIMIPENYFGFRIPKAEKAGKYFLIQLAEPVSKARKLLKELSKKGFKTKAFSQMKMREIMRITGLGKKEATMARKREYCEAFLLLEGSEKKLAKEIRKKGFTFTQGGKLSHILRGGGKGKALRELKKLYAKKYEKPFAIAIGDSENDLEMLEEADFGILVKRHDGTYASKKFAKAKRMGPKGWNEAVSKGIMAAAKKERAAENSKNIYQ